MDVGLGTITEGGKAIWRNGKQVEGVETVSFDSEKIDTLSGTKYLIWIIGSESYEMQW